MAGRSAVAQDVPSCQRAERHVCKGRKTSSAARFASAAYAAGDKVSRAGQREVSDKDGLFLFRPLADYLQGKVAQDLGDVLRHLRRPLLLVRRLLDNVEVVEGLDSCYLSARLVIERFEILR